jgi:hypothetical protein
MLVEVCEAGTAAVVKYGGRIEKTADGDVLMIPVQKPKPSKLEQCWEAGPAAKSVFTEEEQGKIEAVSTAKCSRADSAETDSTNCVWDGGSFWPFTRCGS